MKCKKCGFRNKSQDNYCYKCGKKFSKEEQEKAKRKNIFYIANKIKGWYDTLTLSKLTGSLPWKIGTIVITLIVGIYYVVVNGYSFKIKEGDDYSFEYNKQKDVYYLYLDKEEVNVNVYAPHRVESVAIKKYDEKDNLVEEKEYDYTYFVKVSLDNRRRYYYKIFYDNHEEIKLYTFESGEKSE